MEKNLGPIKNLLPVKLEKLKKTCFLDKNLATVTSNLHHQLKAPEEVLVSSIGCRGHNIKNKKPTTKKTNKTFHNQGQLKG